MPRTVPAVSLTILLGAAMGSLAAAETPICSALATPLAAGARAPLTGEGDSGGDAFIAFRQATAEAAHTLEMSDAAARISALNAGKPVAEADAGLASCLLRAYVQ